MILCSMFSNYLATQKDLRTVEDGLRFVLHSKMRFIFKDKSKIVNIAVISYDSKFIYVWKIKPINLAYKLPHKIKIKDEWQSGWWAGIEMAQIENLLPAQIKNKSRFEIPIISGGLLTPFIRLQKAKKIQYNSYVTQESYLATIIHEFGHVYWDSFKMWWPSENSINLRNLKIAGKLYSNLRPNIEKYSLTFPVFPVFGEVFAFCAEYYASELFWKNHKRNLDSFIKNHLNTLIILEKKKNLEKEDSVIEPSRYPHDFAFVFGKIILEKYPTSWPQILTDQKNISPKL